MTRLERDSKLFAAAMAVVAAAFAGLIAWQVAGPGEGRGVLAALAGVIVGAGLYWPLTGRWRRRAAALRTPFPEDWREILRDKVAFYHALDAEQQAQFERRLTLFLAETRVTFVGLPADDTTRLLAASAAIIPVFGWPEWEYHELAEILIYPGTFDETYGTGDRDGHPILGMVGSGDMNRLMILSQPDLLHGFEDPKDGGNVGIHEFAHILDKADGLIDGIPAGVLKGSEIAPWRALMTSEMERLAAGDSVLDRYGLTNEAELFAVATEAFFEKPEPLAERHPELYRMLKRVFRQDTTSRLAGVLRSAWRRRGGVGRNDPCPCGSGQKFKRCCQGN